MSKAEPPDLTDPNAPPTTSWADWLVMQTDEPDPIGPMAQFLLNREHGGPARLAFGAQEVQQGLLALFEKFNRDTDGQQILLPVEMTPVADLRRHDLPLRVERAGEDSVTLTLTAGESPFIALTLTDEQALRLVEDVMAALRPGYS